MSGGGGGGGISGSLRYLEPAVSRTIFRGPREV